MIHLHTEACLRGSLISHRDKNKATVPFHHKELKLDRNCFGKDDSPPPLEKLLLLKVIAEKLAGHPRVCTRGKKKDLMDEIGALSL